MSGVQYNKSCFNCTGDPNGGNWRRCEGCRKNGLIHWRYRGCESCGQLQAEIDRLKELMSLKNEEIKFLQKTYIKDPPHKGGA